MRLVLAALAAVMVLGAACGPRASDTAAALKETPAQPQAVTATSQAAPTAEPPAAKGAETTATAAASAPAAGAASERLPVDLVQSGWTVDDRQFTYAFLVENPNEGFAIERSEYQVAIYDEAGVVIETSSGFIALLLPAQTMGVAGSAFLEEDQVPARVEIQVKAGRYSESEPQPFLTVDRVRFVEGQFFKHVTGVVQSPYEQDLTNIRVSAVTYDVEGNITGGGLSFIEFVPAGGQTGAEVPIQVNEPPARVELYPALSGLSSFDRDARTVEGEPLTLVASGYGVDGDQLSIGLIVENPNDGVSIEDSIVQITVYDPEGFVVATQSSYINLVLPGQRLGEAERESIPDGSSVGSIDVQLRVGEVVPAERQPVITAENVTFLPGRFSDEVTGVLVSPYEQDVSDLYVVAITYDAEGNINGAGFTYLEFLPAGGRAAVEVPVTVGSPPGSVELYGAITAISEFG